MPPGYEVSGKAKDRPDRHPAVAFCERIEPSAEHLEDIDTARLVIRMQAGDPDSFAALYKRYFDRVYGYIRVAVKDSHEAEDIAQQVFTQLYTSIPDYERRSQPFRAWLFAIARNRLVDNLRKHDRLDVTDPTAIDKHRELNGFEENGARALTWVTDRDLLVFIERLPLAQRQVLALSFMMGLRSSEIAQVLGRSEADVRAVKSRALRFLRQRLTAIGREPKRGPAEVSRRCGRQAVVLRRRRFALLHR